MMFSLDKIFGQIENDLERSFDKHWLNYVQLNIWPLVLVRLGFEPTASRSADRRSSNWANQVVVDDRKAHGKDQLFDLHTNVNWRSFSVAKSA